MGMVPERQVGESIRCLTLANVPFVKAGHAQAGALVGEASEVGNLRARSLIMAGQPDRFSSRFFSSVQQGKALIVVFTSRNEVHSFTSDDLETTLRC